jgi:5-hydroxyisourate hydrolase
MSLSTHVLDATAGRPAAGVEVRLERRDADGWTPVADGHTDADGRIKGWHPETAGEYRLIFATGEHYARHGIEAFHPEVTVAFRITDPADHHHVPLLLGPYSYTTYRGS